MSNPLFNSFTHKLPRGILSKLGVSFDTRQNITSKAKTNHTEEVILSKFEATLLGALIGDCVGEEGEGIWGPNLHEILNEFRLMKENSDCGFDSTKLKTYSEASALTFCVCESLINNSGIDLEDLSCSFLEKFNRDPKRGYSNQAVTLFRKLNQLKFNNQISTNFFTPSFKSLEDSSGSSAGIRCAPIALLTYDKPLEEMELACELSTKVTHNNMWSVIGALQQCYAIRLALDSNKPFDFDVFFNKILEFVRRIERNYNKSDILHSENAHKYSKNMQEMLRIYLSQKNNGLINAKDKRLLMQNKQLSVCTPNSSASNSGFKNFKDDLKILSKSSSLNSSGSKVSVNEDEEDESNLKYSNFLLKFNKLIKKCRKGEKISTQNFHKQVASGSEITALEPMALFVFMIASDPMCSNEVNQKLNSKDSFKEFDCIERVIFYAITYGDQSNKLASLAGAIAGAFFSKTHLPNYLIETCESHLDVLYYAQKLYELGCTPKKEEIENEKNEIENEKNEIEKCQDSFYKNENN